MTPTGVDESRANRPLERDLSNGVGRPGLGVVSLSQGGDGIAYLARLLYRACSDLFGSSPRLVELSPASTSGVTFRERTRFMARLLAEVARERADWWIYNHVGIAQAQSWVPRFFHQPYGVFLHGIEVWDPDLPSGRRAALRRATVRIANSHHTARRVSELYPEAGPVIPCPLGLLPDLPAGEADEAVLQRVGPRSVVIVGRMSASERYKGHDQLLDCWPRVLERVPDAQLVVAGRGDDMERLRRKAAEIGIDRQVMFPGFVSDATLSGLLQRAAAFAMPSRGEGFGLVYLQAMQAGLPCVGSTADAAGDVIASGETGFLVEQEDHGELAEALVCLLGNEDLRRRLGEAGRQLFLKEFTYESFRARLGAVLYDAFGRAERVER